MGPHQASKGDVMKYIKLEPGESEVVFKGSDRVVNLIKAGPKHSYLWIGYRTDGCFGTLSGERLERLAVSILKEFGWEITR